MFEKILNCWILFFSWAMHYGGLKNLITFWSSDHCISIHIITQLLHWMILLIAFNITETIKFTFRIAVPYRCSYAIALSRSNQNWAKNFNVSVFAGERTLGESLCVYHLEISMRIDWWTLAWLPFYNNIMRLLLWYISIT